MFAVQPRVIKPNMFISVSVSVKEDAHCVESGFAPSLSVSEISCEQLTSVVSLSDERLATHKRGPIPVCYDQMSKCEPNFPA